jgi:hypothetical protein
MDKKKAAMIIGGVAALGIAAYFFLGQKTEDDFGAAGGAAGQYGGYEGGGPGPSYTFGGDQITFPGQDNTAFNDLLKALMGGGGIPEGETKKEAASGSAANLSIVGVFQKPADYQAVAAANKAAYGIPAKFTSGQDGQAGAFPDLSASVGGILDVLFKPAALVGGAAVSAKKTITGGSSGGGILGTASGGYTGASGFVAPAPVAVLGQSGGTRGVPGSSEAAQYVQSKYGQPGSGYTVRGYSLTGVPLYRPVKG